MDWIDLVQDRDKWPALFNMVMDFCYHIMREFSRVDEEILSSQERLSNYKEYLTLWS